MTLRRWVTETSFVTHKILLALPDCSYFYPREASAAPAASF